MHLSFCLCLSKRKPSNRKGKVSVVQTMTHPHEHTQTHILTSFFLHVVWCAVCLSKRVLPVIQLQGRLPGERAFPLWEVGRPVTGNHQEHTHMLLFLCKDVIVNALSF